MATTTTTLPCSDPGKDDVWLRWAKCQHCRQFIAPDPPAYGWYMCKKSQHGSCHACLIEHMYYCRLCDKHKNFEHNRDMARFAYHLPLDLPCPRCHTRVAINDLLPGGSHDHAREQCTVSSSATSAYAVTQPWPEST
jgi:hypothetical protein